MELADGRTLQGYKRNETPQAIDLFDPTTRQTHTIAKNEIDELRVLGTLMPDGLAAAMTADQRRDVIRFLLELGQTAGLENESVRMERR